MRALRYNLLSPRTALVKAAGRRRPQVWAGRLSLLQLVDVPEPTRPGPQWARLAVRMGGICGSDLKFLTVDASLAITAFSAWRRPMILGHEIVATVLEAPADSGLHEGDRVVAEPTLACQDRGLDPCPACTAGDDELCQRLGDAGRLAPGHGFGFAESLGGGWAEQVVAPAWRCLPVPDSLTDADAILIEPMACVVHAIRRAAPPRQRALIIGPGTMGLATQMALRTLHPNVELTVVGVDNFADDLCRRNGAAHLLHGGRLALLENAATLTGGVLRRPALGLPYLDPGYDTVYDCVGTAQTVTDALHLLRPGGELALIATAQRITVDWSPVWQRNLRVTGSVYYGTEPDGRRSFVHARELIEQHRPAELVTHRFRLDQAEVALRTAAAGPAAGAVKVAFTP